MIHSLPTTTLHNHILQLSHMNVPVYDIQQLWDTVSVYDFIMLQQPAPFNLNTSIHSDAIHRHLNKIRNKHRTVNSNKDHHNGILYHHLHFLSITLTRNSVLSPARGHKLLQENHFYLYKSLTWTSVSFLQAHYSHFSDKVAITHYAWLIKVQSVKSLFCKHTGDGYLRIVFRQTKRTIRVSMTNSCEEKFNSWSNVCT